MDLAEDKERPDSHHRREVVSLTPPRLSCGIPLWETGFATVMT
jgi:hypothetical protein